MLDKISNIINNWAAYSFLSLLFVHVILKKPKEKNGRRLRRDYFHDCSIFPWILSNLVRRRLRGRSKARSNKLSQNSGVKIKGTIGLRATVQSAFQTFPTEMLSKRAQAPAFGWKPVSRGTWGRALRGPQCTRIIFDVANESAPSRRL